MENNKLIIFVVEDSVFYQHLISKMLEQLCAEILFFTSGEKAVAHLAMRAPDMAIIDYNLDGHMTGLDTLQAIRQQQPDLYVILFSTQTELHTTENVKQYGNFDFVEKSMEGLQLLKKKVARANCFLQMPWI